MTQIKKPEFLSKVCETAGRTQAQSENNGFLHLMRMKPLSSHSIARNVGFRKGNYLEEDLSFQTVPVQGTSAKKSKMADNIPVSPVFSPASAAAAEPCSVEAEKGASGDASLLYQSCDNCIRDSVEPSSVPVDNLNFLSPYHRKAAHALRSNVASLIAAYGIDRLGFLTLTFADEVTDSKEASRRFRSFNSNYLAPHPHFGAWICVKERQKRGAWHYHLLIDCGRDIRTGIDWDEIKRRRYSSASVYLRGLWQELRQALPKYGFGRSELLPIRKTAEEMSYYVGKYISKHIDARFPEDKKIRLCSYSQKWPRSNSNFQWNTENSKNWRENVSKLAEFLDCTFEELTSRLGERWAWRYQEEISKGIIPLEVREELLALHEARYKWQKKYSPLTEVQPRGAAGPLSTDCDGQHAAAAASLKMPGLRFRLSGRAISKSTGGT